MGQSIIDLFKAETEIEIKAGELFALMKEASKAEFLMNAIKCEVPYHYALEMATGERRAAKEEKQLRERLEETKSLTAKDFPFPEVLKSEEEKEGEDQE